MAIFKANYCKRGPEVKNLAKGSVRYIQHRRDKDGEKITRTLYGPDGLMERSDAYRMIDAATKGSFFYRFVISPDPQAEDHHHDLDMRDIAMQTMAALEDRFGVPLNWVAATHSDHAPHLHAHLIAIVPHKLDVQDLGLLRETATQACLEQRLFLDQSLTRERERPYPAFSLDTYAPCLDSLFDLPEPRQGDTHPTPATPAETATEYTRSRQHDPNYRQYLREFNSHALRLSSRGDDAREPHSFPSSDEQTPRRTSQRALFRAPPQSTCTCPRCQHVHVHHTRHPVHRCDACGLVLHRQKQLTLQPLSAGRQDRQGRGLGWQW